MANIDIPEVELLRNLPEWLTQDPTVASISYALDQQFKEVIAAIPECLIIPVIEQLTNSDLIDLLAFQFHVDFYDPTDTLVRRRALVAKSLVWHRKKGTVALVQEVLNWWFPGGAAIEEWFQYKDPFPPNYPIDDPEGEGTWHDRYRFRIVIDQTVIPPDAEAKALLLIDRYKPVSRWLEDVIRSRVSNCGVYWAGAMVRWRYIVIEAPELRN